MKNLSRKDGFSLIEISIVLIIIGLLIAGITGGAALIKSSELRAVMSEARGFQTAVNAFYVQFDALPGDYSNETGSGTSDIATGITGADVAATLNNDQINYTNKEGVRAFQHLNAAGIYSTPSGVTYGADDTENVAGTGIPGSKVKFGGWAFNYAAFGGGTSINAVVFNKDVNSDNTYDGSLSGTDALSVDTKLDDGTFSTGNVRAGTAGAGTTICTAATAADGCVAAFQVDVVL